MSTASLILCGDESEVESLTQRGFSAIFPPADATTPVLAEYRGSRVLVTPTARRDRAGVAHVLWALKCDVRVLDPGFAADSDDPLNTPTEPLLTREVNKPDADGLNYTFAHDLGGAGDEADELVERMLTCGAMSVIYGDSNSGKTFLGVDIGCAVARGIAWMGRNVEPGLVVYLATESPASVRRRLRAYHLHHGCCVPNFAIVQSPVNLYNGDVDTQLVIELVQRLEQEQDAKCQLVIGDTLSRLSAGANENSGEDMSIVVRHVDRVRRESEAHFLLIHHTGKDAAKGMRGWSGLRAATDTEVEITAADETGAHAAEVTKQRDIPGKGDRIGFRLQPVELGIGKWGMPITSCVVLDADAPIRKTPGKRPSEIAGAITELLTSRGSGMKRRELVDHFAARYNSSAVYRELKKMAEAGKLREVLGVIALTNERARH